MPPRLTRLAATRESFSLAAALAGLIVGSILGLALLRRPTAPLFGRASVGELSALSGAALCALAFLVTTLLIQQRSPGHWRLRVRPFRRILDAVGLTLLHAAVGLFAISGAFWVFSQAFLGLELDPAAGAICVGLALALACYLGVASAGALTTSYLSVLIALFLGMGAMSSALTAANPNWWQQHFSSLGAAADLSGVTFNFTLLLSGLVLTTLADYLTHDLSLWAETHGVPERRVQFVRIGFVLVGVMLALVGLIPVNLHFTAHNSVAYGMVAVFAALLIAVPLLFRRLSPAFNTATVFIAAALLADVVLHLIVGYLNVTAFEMIGVAIIFGWLVLLIRTITAAVTDQENAATEGYADRAPERA